MSRINEQQVRDYLMAHPDWLFEQSDLLPQGSSEKIKDFREALLAKAQVDNQALIERQQQWLDALHTNETLLKVLWHSAAQLAQAKNYQTVLKIVEQLLFEVLDFPEYALKLNAPLNKRPVPTFCRLDEQWTATDIKAYSHLPHVMSDWFAQSHANFLMVPILSGQNVLGVWVIASEQEGYFHNQLDTTYLEMFAQVLGAVLSRLMGMPVSC